MLPCIQRSALLLYLGLGCTMCFAQKPRVPSFDPEHTLSDIDHCYLIDDSVTVPHEHGEVIPMHDIAGGLTAHMIPGEEFIWVRRGWEPGIEGPGVSRALTDEPIIIPRDSPFAISFRGQVLDAARSRAVWFATNYRGKFQYHLGDMKLIVKGWDSGDHGKVKFRLPPTIFATHCVVIVRGEDMHVRAWIDGDPLVPLSDTLMPQTIEWDSWGDHENQDHQLDDTNLRYMDKFVWFRSLTESEVLELSDPETRYNFVGGGPVWTDE